MNIKQKLIEDKLKEYDNKIQELYEEYLEKEDIEYKKFLEYKKRILNENR